jgi:hypothetical protein
MSLPLDLQAERDVPKMENASGCPGRLCTRCESLDFSKMFFGDPRKKVVYPDKEEIIFDHMADYLGSLQEIRQRATRGCNLCALVIDERIFEVYGTGRQEVIDALKSGLDTSPCRVYIAIRLSEKVIARIKETWSGLVSKAPNWPSVYPLKLYTLFLFHDYPLSSLPPFTTRPPDRDYYIELLNHPGTDSIVKNPITPKNDLKMFRHWLDDCVNQHSLCNRKVDVPAVFHSTHVCVSITPFQTHTDTLIRYSRKPG